MGKFCQQLSTVRQYLLATKISAIFTSRVRVSIVFPSRHLYLQILCIFDSPVVLHAGDSTADRHHERNPQSTWQALIDILFQSRILPIKLISRSASFPAAPPRRLRSLQRAGQFDGNFSSCRSREKLSGRNHLYVSGSRLSSVVPAVGKLWVAPGSFH